jgi:hypothetical protein
VAAKPSRAAAGRKAALFRKSRRLATCIVFIRVFPRERPAAAISLWKGAALSDGRSRSVSSLKARHRSLANPRCNASTNFYRDPHCNSVIHNTSARVDCVASSGPLLRNCPGERVVQNHGQVISDGANTFGWFVHNCYFPLGKGDGKEETAKNKGSLIQAKDAHDPTQMS